MSKQAQIIRVLIITLVLNFLIALSKLLYGYFSGTLSMIADGFHSALDGISNIVGLVAIFYAYQPPDADHHYGHRKAEILASMGIAVLLALSSLEVFKQWIYRLFNPQVSHITSTAFIVMAIGLVVNVFVTYYESKEGQRLQSSILVSDAAHTRSDILVTLSVFVSLVGIHYQFYWIDLLVCGGIILVISQIAYQIFKHNLAILMDTAPIETEHIKQIVSAIEGVKNCHKIRTHGMPDAIYIELHIWVDPQMTITEAHQLAHIAKDRIISKIQDIKDVTIHVEPAS